ncbi:hypothetical protein N7474_008793 [Penicillium riverlandense]|uniref:uncharacterized protein n=1 Tax=Penicillium riverlandense TaxID=1903569 RepID=UPI0025486525|nr:uncharacterized protein N7474_008793 [Penicillium riverlandense]KAJ5812492.1 hypothetical protein N7474_008793 [Penicillium riverlandense]
MYYQDVLHSVLLLSAAFTTAQAWQQTDDGDVKEPPYPLRCQPDPCANITFSNASYVCGDFRLGPVKLPRYFPLSTELATYARFGDLCPYEFLAKWTWDNGSYHYPDEHGFVLDNSGAPILGNTTLPVGQKVDRFGGETGNYFSPLGAPYIERALPPYNLDNNDGDYPYNYHVYEVIQELPVTLGPVTPWFEQPGMGTQFTNPMTMAELVDKNFLRRLARSEYDNKADFADNYTPGPNS